MKNTIRILSTILVASFSTPVFAAGHVRLNALYWSQETGQTTQTKTTRTLLDIGAGYSWPSGLMVGGLYGTEKLKSDDNSTDRTSFGPSIGFVVKDTGPFIIGTYFIESEYEDFKGKGYEVDLGYKFKVSAFSLGLMLAYKKFEYDKNGSTTVSPPLTSTHIDPYFSFWFEF